MKKGIMLGLAILIALSAIGVGVYAAAISKAYFSPGVSVGFDTIEVFANVTCNAYVGNNQSAIGSTYTNKSYDNDNVPISLPNWQIPKADLDSDNKTLVLEFSIRNDGPTAAKITVTRPTAGTLSNCSIVGGYDKGKSYSGGILVVPTNGSDTLSSLAVGSTAVFTYYITATNDVAGSFGDFTMKIVKA